MLEKYKTNGEWTIKLNLNLKCLFVYCFVMGYFGLNKGVECEVCEEDSGMVERL